MSCPCKLCAFTGAAPRAAPSAADPVVVLLVDFHEALSNHAGRVHSSASTSSLARGALHNQAALAGLRHLTVSLHAGDYAYVAMPSAHYDALRARQDAPQDAAKRYTAVDAAELQGSRVLGLLCERKATADLVLCVIKDGERYERQKAQLRAAAAVPRHASAPLYLVESNSDAVQRVRPGAHGGGVEQGYSEARVRAIRGQAEAAHLVQGLAPLRSAGIEATIQKLAALACPLAAHRLAGAWAGNPTFGEWARGVLHGRGQLRAAGAGSAAASAAPSPAAPPLGSAEPGAVRLHPAASCSRARESAKLSSALQGALQGAAAALGEEGGGGVRVAAGAPAAAGEACPAFACALVCAGRHRFSLVSAQAWLAEVVQLKGVCASASASASSSSSASASASSSGSGGGGGGGGGLEPFLASCGVGRTVLLVVGLDSSDILAAARRAGAPLNRGTLLALNAHLFVQGGGASCTVLDDFSDASAAAEFLGRVARAAAADRPLESWGGMGVGAGAGAAAAAAAEAASPLEEQRRKSSSGGGGGASSGGGGGASSACASAAEGSAGTGASGAASWPAGAGPGAGAKRRREGGAGGSGGSRRSPEEEVVVVEDDEEEEAEEEEEEEEEEIIVVDG